jgi:Ras-related protein Rab-1A
LSTIGVDFRFKLAELPDPTDKNKKLKLKLQIWDTAGQEKFRSITKAYYRGADGLLIVYDITEKQSFVNIKNWIKEIRSNVDHSIPIIIVGNKSDRHDRIIQESELEKLALEFNTFHMETSALNSDNVEKTFLLLANECLNLKLNDNSGHVDSHTVPFIHKPITLKNNCIC